MPPLSSLLVQRNVATVQEVEQAIARQVIHGGDLITNLLEVAPRSEPALLPVLAESAGLAPGPAGRLPVPDGDLLDAIPAELALGHGFFPLAREGDEIVLATPAPLAPATVANLEQSLSAKIAERAAPMIRVREAIAAQYGIPLDARQLKLVKKLEAARAGVIVVPSVPPQAAAELGPRALPKAPSQAPSTFGSGLSGDDEGWDSGDRASEIEPFPAFVPAAEAPPVVAEETYEEPEAAAERAFVEGPTELAPPSEPEEPLEPTVHEAETAAAPPVEARRARPAPELDEASPPPSSVIDRRAIGGLIKRELAEKRARDKSARRKGPFIRVEAERELDEAASADQLIDVFFAFASQYFEYSALFRVQGDIAEGRDAWGPGASREKVLTLGVPLDLPSSFQAARVRASIVLTKMNEEALDTDISTDLGRARARGATHVAAIVPIALRSRVVALLYGDDSHSDVTIQQIGDLVGFSALASKNLERIALTKKLGHAPPKVRAVSSTGISRGAGSVPPAAPAPLSSPGPASSPRAASVEMVAPSSRGGRATTQELVQLPSLGTARTELAVPGYTPTTEPYDDRTFGPVSSSRDALRGARASVLDALRDNAPKERVPTLVGQGAAPESVTQPRSRLEEKLSRGRPLRREEDDDASEWLAREGGSPEPPHARVSAAASKAEYVIIPDRARPEEGGTRAREAALFGPYGALLVKATLGGIQAEEALAELAREADHSLPKIVAAFPGPLVVDRFRMRDALPQASQCGPLLRLLVMLRRSALGFMTVRSASPDADQRFWATHVLGELLFPEAGAAVLPRLFDDDVMVRRVAKRAAIELVKAGAPGEPFMRSLADMIGNFDEPPHRRALAIEAVGDIRAASMVPALIDTLDDPNDVIADATRRALLLVTRQDLGPSPHEWRAWWNANKDRHRIEWLIDALTHETPSLRRAAGDELKSLTNEYFGYYDDLPPREREKAQQKYRTWWDDEGRYRFP